MGNIQQFFQILDRQGGTDPVGQLLGKQFEKADFPDVFKKTDVIVNDALDSFVLPPPPETLLALQARFGKSTET